ncbi:hypothetical protein [Limobrevibacterium gyesilva]|uniref:Uncharacterized protein n=1 Tax=Limobrevibacterium gyesilva TaxID=2991712 RepID=A0AA42CGB6_9PROT|nr:hypothetical protein [Limobrevibacterium gyesilva]MCW3477529.1 hypothetical protein [Limobrevibacterium gyesilva]
MTISINVLHGLSNVTDDDKERARSAAQAVLNKAGVRAADAYVEFQRQWRELGTAEAAAGGKVQHHDSLTGLAALWILAEQAADIALTEGWADPNGASCSISAWPDCRG